MASVLDEQARIPVQRLQAGAHPSRGIGGAQCKFAERTHRQIVVAQIMDVADADLE